MKMACMPLRFQVLTRINIYNVLKSVILLVIAVCASGIRANPNPPVEEFNLQGFAQGTTYSIRYYAADSLVRRYQVDSLLRVIDQSMSIYNAESKISLFNKEETKEMSLDIHMQKVIRASLKYNKLTKGFFDITVLPLVNLWGFGPQKKMEEPTSTQIDSVRKFVGIDKILLKGNRLIKRASKVSLVLDGIAQGYTVDILADFFKSKQVNRFIIELGGEIYAYGVKPDGESFKVRIQRPYRDSEEGYIVTLQDRAITTSGNYEKYRITDGQHISHHINPATGRTVQNTTISVTVIAKTAMQADALDNYLMFLPPEEAIAFVEKQKEVEAYIIYEENNELKELQSSGFNNYIYNINHKPN